MDLHTQVLGDRIIRRLTLGYMIRSWQARKLGLPRPR